MQCWGLERQELLALRHAPLGREHESAGALGLQGRATPEGRSSGKAGSLPLGTHALVITTTPAPDPTCVHTCPSHPGSLAGREPRTVE